MDPPRSEIELQARLSALEGRDLLELGPVRGKGGIGLLLEKTLGATSGSRAEPDFPALGIELKSVPVDSAGRPLESTFVASLDLAATDLRWEVSPVRHKLQRIAWVTVHEQVVVRALLWSPSAAQEQVLRDDYEEIIDLISEGYLERVTAHTGAALQLRPKGRNAAHLRGALDEEGAPSRAPPRAFYLRRTFTSDLLRR